MFLGSFIGCYVAVYIAFETQGSGRSAFLTARVPRQDSLQCVSIPTALMETLLQAQGWIRQSVRKIDSIRETSYRLQEIEMATVRAKL